MTPIVDPFTWRRMLAWFDGHPDALPGIAALIAAAVVTQIAELWR